MLRFVSDRRLPGGSVTRREWLRIGGTAGLGLSLSERLPAVDVRADRDIPGFGRARSVLLVVASGGQSQLDLWDPKPHAPAEIRGEFQSIRTAVPGTLLCEHVPRLARIADKFTIVRSMSHEDLDHGTAFYLMMTGRYHRLRSANPPPSPDDLPAAGAVLTRVRPTREFAHTAVHLNGPALLPEIVGPGQFAGLLGRENDPLQIGDVAQQTVALPGLSPHADLPTVRIEARQTLLEAVDRYRHRAEQDRALGNMSTLYQQAFEMLSRSRTRQAFDLRSEPAKLRDRYGRNRSGQACLLARRLVEAGVPLVTVIANHKNRGQDKQPDNTDTYGWDTHNDIFVGLKKHLLPRFDQSFSALLEDLDERGLLAQTLVICMGEFGRAPLVALEPKFAGSSPGRKHWSAAYSIVMAGAGVGRGRVFGASDRNGAYPISNPVGPWDVTATMFSALGVDPSGHYEDALGRPFPISTGRPIAGLYAS